MRESHVANELIIQRIEWLPSWCHDAWGEPCGGSVANPPRHKLCRPPLHLSLGILTTAQQHAGALQTSNIMHLEPRPFDPATFDKEEETYEDDVTGEVKVRLRDESTIRWRIVPDGEGAQHCGLKCCPFACHLPRGGGSAISRFGLRLADHHEFEGDRSICLFCWRMS